MLTGAKAQSILTVSHSTGDTQVILSAAREFAKKGSSVTILVVGQAALTQVKQASFTVKERELINITDLDSLLPDEKPISQNALSLSEQQMSQVKAKLKFESFSAMLVGTPSYTDPKAQCSIPEQLLSEYAPHLPTAVMSDYAFYDPAHTLSTTSWFKKANILLVPFQKAISALKADPAKSVVVGHPSIDALKEKFKTWSLTLEEALKKKSDILRKLEVGDTEKLVFVASGKAGDEALMQALAQTCKKYKSVKIKIGLHPGASEQYHQSLLQMIIDQDASQQMSILPQNFITTEECVFTADGVITVSSTVATAAAVCERVAGFYQEGKQATDPGIPYIVDDLPNVRLYSSVKSLTTFFDAVVAKQTKQDTLDLSTQSSAANIVEAIQSLRM